LRKIAVCWPKPQRLPGNVLAAAVTRRNWRHARFNSRGSTTSSNRWLCVIAKAFENNIDDEQGWHMESMRRLSIDIPGVRPALFPGALAADLQELRGFRHVVRHAYDLTFRKENSFPSFMRPDAWPQRSQRCVFRALPAANNRGTKLSLKGIHGI
jgi:hypothetical protein